MTDRTRIDAILTALPADQRAALQDLRETIAQTATDRRIVRARMAETDARWGSRT